MTDLAREVSELKKQGASIKEALNNINSPDYGRTRAKGNMLSYFQDDDAEREIRINPKKKHQLYKSRVLKGGYKNERFKSLGGYLQEGIKKTPSFEKDHATIWKTVQGMSEQVGADGGFLVLPEFNEQILERVYDNDLFSRTNQFTVTGNNMTFLRNAETSRVDGSRWGGLQGRWVGEGATITDSKPTFKEVSLKLKKLAVVVYLTEELRDDATALEQYVTSKVPDEFNFMLGDAVFNGTGAGKTLGILQSPALLAIAKETGQLASSIVTENIDKMWARRLVSDNYNWYTNQDTGPEINNLDQVVGTGGTVLNRPPGGISAAPFQTLMGVPRIDTEFNATLGTQGDIVLADLGQVLSIVKGGIAQAVSIHVEFLTDQVALRFTMRVDMRPWEDTPITPFKGSNTQSAFVTLADRS